MDLNNLKNIEELELKYLNKYYYFLKFCEDEMFFGFRTKENIKEDWKDFYDPDKIGISDFAVGAEKIVYSLINGKGIGQPNSAPVGSDLFFEVEDEYIHIDMKTVHLGNIGDYYPSIFVGRNQNSYKGNIKLQGSKKTRLYEPALPTYYNKGKKNQKICLSYFITILYNRDTLDIYTITIDCMPNGELEEYYGTKVLSAGKVPTEARFNRKRVSKFELLDNKPTRTKVVYYDMKVENGLNNAEKNKLKWFRQLYCEQENIIDEL